MSSSWSVNNSQPPLRMPLKNKRKSFTNPLDSAKTSPWSPNCGMFSSSAWWCISSNLFWMPRSKRKRLNWWTIRTRHDSIDNLCGNTHITQDQVFRLTISPSSFRISRRDVIFFTSLPSLCSFLITLLTSYAGALSILPFVGITDCAISSWWSAVLLWLMIVLI